MFVVWQRDTKLVPISHRELAAKNLTIPIPAIRATCPRKLWPASSARCKSALKHSTACDRRLSRCHPIRLHRRGDSATFRASCAPASSSIPPPKARRPSGLRTQSRPSSPQQRGAQKTAAPQDARRLAAEAIAEGCDTLIAAGGDGTINEVLNGIGDEPDAFAARAAGRAAAGHGECVCAGDENSARHRQGLESFDCARRVTRS